MLARSQRTQLSEENAVHSRLGGGHSHFAKTPAKQGPLAGPSRQPLTTGGKGLLTTAKSSRVLGQKDANARRTPVKEATLLFPGKSKTAQKIAPAFDVRQSFLSPAQVGAKLSHTMQTPSPGVRRAAQMHFSPEAQVEAEDEIEEEEENFDGLEVEVAGASSRDYDEPVVSDFALPDPEAASASFVVQGANWSHDADFGALEAFAQDALEFKCTIDTEESRIECIDALDDPTKALFPPVKRQPLAAKQTNGAKSLAAARPRPGSSLRPSTAMSNSTTASSAARRPVTASARLGLPAPKPSSITENGRLAPAPIRKPSSASLGSSRPTSAASMRAPSALANGRTRPGSALAAKSNSTERKPLKADEKSDEGVWDISHIEDLVPDVGFAAMDDYTFDV